MVKSRRFEQHDEELGLDQGRRRTCATSWSMSPGRCVVRAGWAEGVCGVDVGVGARQETGARDGEGASGDCGQDQDVP